MIGELTIVLKKIYINLLKFKPRSDCIPLKLLYIQKTRHLSSQQFNETTRIPQFTGNYFRVGRSKK